MLKWVFISNCLVCFAEDTERGREGGNFDARTQILISNTPWNFIVCNIKNGLPCRLAVFSFWQLLLPLRPWIQLINYVEWTISRKPVGHPSPNCTLHNYDGHVWPEQNPIHIRCSDWKTLSMDCTCIKGGIWLCEKKQRKNRRKPSIFILKLFTCTTRDIVFAMQIPTTPEEQKYARSHAALLGKYSRTGSFIKHEQPISPACQVLLNQRYNIIPKKLVQSTEFS